MNLSPVMFLGGLWHGASWNFVIWGLMHGMYLSLHKIISDRFPVLQNHKFFRSKIGKIVSICIMQYFVFLAWIPFRVNDIDYAIYSMSKFVFLDFKIVGLESILLAYKIPIALILLFVVLHYISYMRPNIVEKIAKLGLISWGVIICVILTAIVFFYDGNPADFIYFRF